MADNVPRDQVLVVHDAIWTDLVHQYGFAKDDVIMAYKLDADPAVNARLTHVDYLVVPDWYFTIKDGKYPTLIEAQRHAVPAAHFGTGPTRSQFGTSAAGGCRDVPGKAGGRSRCRARAAPGVCERRRTPP